MAFKPEPGESYTIRRKILTFFGGSFHVYDREGRVVGFCRQRAFKLREDLRLFKDDSKSEELLTMKARQVIDFGATYDVALPEGNVIGSFRRKGMKSLIRDSWLVYDAAGNEIAQMKEDSGGLAILRRVHGLFALLSPQKFHIEDASGRQIATLRSHMNPFVYRLGVAIHLEHEEVDELMVLAAGCLVAAIEGRQG